MYQTSTTLSTLSKLCHIIYTTTGLDVALFDDQYQSLLYLTNKNYPFLNHKIYNDYQSTVLQHLGKLHHSACYMHPLPEAKLLYYDIRIQATHNLVFYACIGPILSEVYSDALVTDLMYQLDIPSSIKESFFAFYQSLPYLGKQTSNALWLGYHLLTTMPDPYLPPTEMTVANNLLKDVAPTRLFNMHSFLSDSEIQSNYHYESLWRSAISRGDLKAAQKAYADLSKHTFAYRMPTNPLRIKKNILFSLNTLCRAAAIDGGADAIKVHKTHESYLMRTENATTVSEINGIENTLLATYCDLVIHSQTKNFSPIVAKAINYLYGHYDEALSLSIVARKIHCSEGHLSRIFQKETTKTLGIYLNQLRITQALSLLKLRQYSISDIALAVGFSSYNKFSIEFKKYTGKSATQYLSELDASNYSS